MIVELIGPPGAGKTTLLPTVIAIFREMDIGAFTVVEAARPFAQRTLLGKIAKRISPTGLHRPILWQVFYRLSLVYRIRFVALHPGLIWRVINSQRGRPLGAELRRRKVSQWFFRLAGYYEFLETYIQPGEVVVFDEGFLHRVVQLFTSSVEKPVGDEIADYVDQLPQPDLTIFIKASEEACEKRIYKRGLWERLRDKNPDEISRFVINAHLAVNQAVDHCRRRGWTVVEVENESDDIRFAQAHLRREMVWNLVDARPAVNLETV